jgi:hypothetical protein
LRSVDTAALEAEGCEKASLHVDFTVRACSLPPPSFPGPEILAPEVARAAEWIGANTPDDINRHRAVATQRILAAGRHFRNCGATDRWHSSTHPSVRSVVAGVNGPLCEWLARESGFCDLGAVESLRVGGPVVGDLPNTGNGTTHDFPAVPDAAELKKTFLERNTRLLASLKEDKHASTLLSQMKEEAKMGRMSTPVRVEEIDLTENLLAKRFAVEQGLRPDGTPKLRPCDDETASGTNGHCRAAEKLRNDSLDMYVILISKIMGLCGASPLLWKADVDAAYRRIPVSPDQTCFVWVAVMVDGVVWVSRHLAMPFGCMGSVHAWNRVGALLCHVGRVMLLIPLERYVDDLFSADRPECAEHAMRCFAEVVRAMLGPTAIAERKLECGNPLVVLGISVAVAFPRIELTLPDDKVAKWSGQIREALASMRLGSGQASKLAGRLGFGAQHTFRRLGRAMLRPIFQQQYAPLVGNRVGYELELGLRWWLVALESKLCDAHIVGETRPVVDMFCDARGSPPRVAAVLVDQLRNTVE